MPPRAQPGTFTWALWKHSSLEGKIYLAWCLDLPFYFLPNNWNLPLSSRSLSIKHLYSRVMEDSGSSPFPTPSSMSTHLLQARSTSRHPSILISNLCSLPFPNNLCSLKIHFHPKDHLASAHDRWYRSFIFWLQDNCPSFLIILAPYSSTRSLLFPLEGNMDTGNLSRTLISR